MNNPKFQLPDFSRTPSPTRKALAEHRLSKLPPFPRRAVCENCKLGLDSTDEFQMKVKICRQCLRTSANVGLILEKYTVEKIRRTYSEAK